MNSIANLSEISRKGEQFFAFYRRPVNAEINLNLPIYTDVGMAGKLNTSETLRKVRPVQRRRVEVEQVEISREEARELKELADLYELVTAVEQIGEREWTIRL